MPLLVYYITTIDPLIMNLHNVVYKEQLCLCKHTYVWTAGMVTFVQ